MNARVIINNKYFIMHLRHCKGTNCTIWVWNSSHALTHLLSNPRYSVQLTALTISILGKHFLQLLSIAIISTTMVKRVVLVCNLYFPNQCEIIIGNGIAISNLFTYCIIGILMSINSRKVTPGASLKCLLCGVVSRILEKSFV